MVALSLLLLAIPIVWLVLFIKAYNADVFKKENRKDGVVGRWAGTGFFALVCFVVGAVILSHWADGVQDWEHWSWIVGGGIGFLVFVGIILFCRWQGTLASPKEDIRSLWSWIIYVGAALLCLIGCIVNLIAIY